MADILSGNKFKKYVRAGIWVLRKKLGSDGAPEQIHFDLENSGNEMVGRIAFLLNEAGNNITEEYQKKVVTELGELFLWILYKDTAYRDILFYLMNEILKMPDAQEIIKPYLKDVDDWYVNIWHRSKEKTKKLRAEGKIPPNRKSGEEAIFVPGYFKNKK